MAAKRKAAPAQREGDYEVGYGRPPAHSRFKAGESGNARGRPRGSKNKGPAWNHAGFDALVRQEAYRSMTINENGRPVTLPVMQAVLRRVSIDALQGRSRAQKLFLNDLLGGAERRSRALSEAFQEEMIRYKKEGRATLDECRRAGTNPPEIIPHPDDIIIDTATGEPELIGPMTPEDKAVWEILAERRDLARQYLADWNAELNATEDRRERRLLRETITLVSAKLQETVDQIGEWPNHRLSSPGKRTFKVKAIFGRGQASAPSHPKGHAGAALAVDTWSRQEGRLPR
jgi:hypothetical protein